MFHTTYTPLVLVASSIFDLRMMSDGVRFAQRSKGCRMTVIDQGRDNGQLPTTLDQNQMNVSVENWCFFDRVGVRGWCWPAIARHLRSRGLQNTRALLFPTPDRYPHHLQPCVLVGLDLFPFWRKEKKILYNLFFLFSPKARLSNSFTFLLAIMYNTIQQSYKSEPRLVSTEGGNSGRLSKRHWPIQLAFSILACCSALSLLSLSTFPSTSFLSSGFFFFKVNGLPSDSKLYKTLTASMQGNKWMKKNGWWVQHPSSSTRVRSIIYNKEPICIRPAVTGQRNCLPHYICVLFCSPAISLFRRLP